MLKFTNISIIKCYFSVKSVKISSLTFLTNFIIKTSRIYYANIHHGNIRIKMPLSQKLSFVIEQSVARSGRFLECQKCNISFIWGKPIDTLHYMTIILIIGCSSYYCVVPWHFQHISCNTGTCALPGMSILTL